MTKLSTQAEPNADALLTSLRTLEEQLSAEGINKNDQAHMLINACMGEGIVTGSRIIGLLAELGFNKQHTGIILKAGVQRDPRWPNWGCHVDGNYYAPPWPSAGF